MKSKTKHWFHGLGAAFIGGGATAITAQSGLVAAQTVGMKVTLMDLKTIGVVFLSSGIFSAVAYLKQSPLPPEDPPEDKPSNP